MAMEYLSCGVNHAIADNLIRGLPTNAAVIFVTPSTATSIDLSNAADMSNAKNVTPTGPSFSEGGAPIAAGFIRVNGGAAIVRLSRR